MQPTNNPLSTLLAALALAGLAVGQYETALTLDQCIQKLDNQLPPFQPSDFHFSGNVRTYYVQAEQLSWDYVPTGWDNWLGVPINDSVRAQEAGYVSAGWKWEKAVYRGYTDSSFTQKTAQPSWQGINGPTLRAEVGDMIQILFVNNLTSHYASMHSMGLAYNKDNEGSDYVNTTTGGSPPIDPGDAVVPGGCYVYKWLVDDASAPDAGLNSKMWSYHPYLSMYNDLNTGLSGPTIVYNRGKMDSTMSSNREFIFLFEIFDETLSWLAFENAQKKQLAAPANPLSIPYNGNVSFWKPQLINMPNVTLTSTQAPAFFTVNGWVYANNPAFEMCLDDNVIWYLYTMGQDTHVFHMHGDFFQYNGQNRASIQISSGMMMTLPMVARATGIWQVICHMTDHLSFGMEALYEVFMKRAGEGCPLDGK